MLRKNTIIGWLLVLAVGLGVAAPGGGQETAWEERLRLDPGAADNASLDPLTRRVLDVLTPQQAEALAGGASPEEILLESGETLAEYLTRTMAGGPGLVYEPVDQCVVFATAAQTAPVTGQMAAGETREFVVRGSGMALTDQGGAVTCMIPDEAVAVVMHFRVVAMTVQNARGLLKVWAADGPEPVTRVVEYEPVVDPPLADRFRFTGTAVVELCPFGACAGGEIKVKTALLGGHVRGDVAGFFRPTVAADVPEAGNAQTLGGMDKSAFAAATHTHDGGDITSGTVAEPFIDSLLARDSEVLGILLDNDGPGSLVDGDLLDGLDSTAFKLQPQNCLTVSPSCPAAAPAALAARCWQTVSAALAAIDGTDLPLATAANRYLIKVGPGTYDEQVVMKAFVDLAGAGQKLTVITNTASPTLDAASDAALSDLTVQNTDGGTAIRNSGVSPMIQHVTALATGAGAPKAVELGMGAAPMLTHVTTGSDGDGVENNSATVAVRDSILGGAVNGIENVGGGSAASIVNSQILGGASDGATGSTFSCLGAYDATFVELDANCQ